MNAWEREPPGEPLRHHRLFAAGSLFSRKRLLQLTGSKFKKGGTRLFTNERFTITRYGNRFWGLYDGEDLICVCVYKVGAREVKRRIEELVARIPQEAAA